jgi:hypothetical protein
MLSVCVWSILRVDMHRRVNRAMIIGVLLSIMILSAIFTIIGWSFVIPRFPLSTYQTFWPSLCAYCFLNLGAGYSYPTADYILAVVIVDHLSMHYS